MEPRPLRNVPAKTALIACLAPLLIATACAAPGGPSTQANGGSAAAAPKRLIAAIHGNPTSILYSLNSGGGGRVDGGMELQGLVNSGMAVQTSGGEWTPVLAEAIPSVDNGLWKIFPDGRSETTWKIRSGATWHDGAPLTGDDFVFTVQLSRDKNMPWLVDPNLSLIDSADSLDPSTVRIAWKQPYIRADQMFGKGSVSVVYPKHILEEPYTRGAGQNISNLSYFTSEYIGTGPFKEKEWVIDQRVTLTAFDGYAPGRPKVDELEVRFIPDAQTIAANILSDTVDFTLGPGLALEEGLAARDRWPQGTMQIGVSGNISMNPQFLNPDPPILANVQFRKALYMSINRQELVDTLTYGLSRPLDANVSPEEPEFKAVQSQIVRYQFDPTKAQQMITDLGYTRGTNGMFADSAGSPLVIQIMATTDDSNAKPQAAVLDMWKQIGITPDLEPVTEQKQRDLAYRANFKAFSLQSGVGFGADNLDTLLSTERRVAENNFTGRNYIRYSNPDIDAQVKSYFTTIQWDQRMQIFGQVEHFATDQLLWFPMFLRVLPTLSSNRMSGLSPVVSSQQGQQWWNANQWDVAN